MIFWIWFIAVSAALILYFRQIYTRFSRRGVKNLIPIPPLGNTWRVLFRVCAAVEDVEILYQAFPNERFVGKYDFMSHSLVIRDLELVKKITVKDFEYFIDHMPIVDPETDPLFGRTLFALHGEEWKGMRSSLSPAFTSSKIRLMIPFMMEAGEHMIRTLEKQIQSSNGDYIDFDTKDLMSRYANDVFASSVFGLKVDSHSDKDNQFYEMVKAATSFKFKQVLAILSFLFFPKLKKLLNISLMSKEITEFFNHLVLNAMKERKEQNIFRPDMIHLLMELKNGKLTHDEKMTQDADAGFATVEESAVGRRKIKRDWSDMDLVAQATVFFFAGFQGISALMSLLLYELAVHTDVQDKLYQEIREHDDKNGGKFDYTSIQEMKYMDMVISELIRIWANPALDRICNNDYNLGKPNDEATEDYIVRKGESVIIPLWAIHRDSKYFPDPLKFDPERFSDENRHKIKPFTYMPFGVGPRNCIGSRFVLCEVKVMAYQLLQAIQISPGAKTTIPAELDKSSFTVVIKGGNMLRFKAREAK